MLYIQSKNIERRNEKKAEKESILSIPVRSRQKAMKP